MLELLIAFTAGAACAWLIKAFHGDRELSQAKASAAHYRREWERLGAAHAALQRRAAPFLNRPKGRDGRFARRDG